MKASEFAVIPMVTGGPSGVEEGCNESGKAQLEASMSTDLVSTGVTHLAMGSILSVEQGDSFGVLVADTQWGEVSCHLLQTSEQPLSVKVGDQVAVWLPDPSRSEGVILGRVGLGMPAHDRIAEVPDELVIEAKRDLTLKCGDGSITIRADGKILIKGKDLVSHAQRLNRIKGGAVQIN